MDGKSVSAALSSAAMSESRKSYLHNLIRRIAVDRVTSDFYEVIFDMLDGAMLTRDEAVELSGLDRNTFSLGLRARRQERAGQRIWL